MKLSITSPISLQNLRESINFIIILKNKQQQKEKLLLSEIKKQTMIPAHMKTQMS